MSKASPQSAKAFSPYSNFHTHTQFCDAKDSAEDMVQAAISQGCEYLGFSGHTYTEFDQSYCMLPADELNYRAEIERLQLAYAGQIKLLTGAERDQYATEHNRFDYVIGSKHYVIKDGQHIAIDNGFANLMTSVEQLWGNDYYAFCLDYYRQMEDILQRTEADIVGHYDLVTKYNAIKHLFDEKDRRYRHAALEMAEHLCSQNAVFEVNSGAIFRGLRNDPYPADFLLSFIREHHGRILFSSDSHNKDSICFRFDQLTELAANAGFRSRWSITHAGLVEVGL